MTDSLRHPIQPRRPARLGLGPRTPDAGQGSLRVPDFPGDLKVHVLDNGLKLCVLRNANAPVVTTVLWYRVGARHDLAGEGGTAHFLEHMMFKGSAAYGEGEVDRITQRLGGSNNAFTSHDYTAYYFNFARDRWGEALKIEADRMATLTLDPDHVDSERQVILEEIAMYQDDPWDSLEHEVLSNLLPDHPYGRSVLGTRDELLDVGQPELQSFHRRFYGPQNAVLVVAGGVDGDVRSSVEGTLGGLSPEETAESATRPQTTPTGLVRVNQHKGEVPRLILALPGPAASDPDHPRLRLLLTVLCGGKSSRLHRDLVEEEHLCVWVTAQLTDHLDPGPVIVCLESVPGVDTRQTEAELLERLVQVTREPPGEEEIERAQQIAMADWVFGHERVHQQALAIGFATSLFDPDYTRNYLEATLRTRREDLLDVARKYLRPEAGGVLGWSYPTA